MLHLEEAHLHFTCFSACDLKAGLVYKIYLCLFYCVQCYLTYKVTTESQSKIIAHVNVEVLNLVLLELQGDVSQFLRGVFPSNLPLFYNLYSPIRHCLISMISIMLKYGVPET